MERQPAQHTFFAESDELLLEMEAALLQLEKTPDDLDALNAVFRAAHTIKGAAGMFGFDAVVDFTHVMESVLADLRAGAITVDAALIALLLSCGDHCRELLAGINAGEEMLKHELLDEGHTLIDQLSAYLAPAVDPADSPAAASWPDAIGQAPREAEVESAGGPTVSSDAWHISLRFGKDVLRNGMDPLSFLRYLATLGNIEALEALFDTMPDAAVMNPESCYLGLEIAFKGAVDKETLANVFEFVQDDCAIHILPPRSKVLDYVRLIDSLPEDKERLGELLVNSGALTRRELEDGLRMQQSLAERKGADAQPEDWRKLGKILVRQGVVQDELIDAALNKQLVIKEHKTLESSFIRVRADNLDELITLVGELVIAGAGTRLLAQRAGNSDLIESTIITEALVEQIRDRALTLRMVPIGEAFTRFKRVVRDLGRELGKDVDLVLSGVETELDKSMIEKISDPLMHLVRNALDHGIESPDVRVQSGKAATGKLYLNAYHDSGSIVIEVADDGAGIDRSKICARAVEIGLATADQDLSDHDIFKVIMEPGFSTADTVTNVSGRGMGMDVVKRNVEDIRGSIAIDSVTGEGTTVTIRLPLTLAIIDGFLVGVGKSAYVVPLEMVVECIELLPQDRVRVRESGYINLRGEVLPLLRIRDVFDTQGEPGKRENIVVVQYAGLQAGFVVDALMGEFQTVIKPLGQLFERLSGISGSTILGTGEVALILDVQALVQRAIGVEAARERSASQRRLLERPSRQSGTGSLT
jgi:two-component system chemotaxis sensor kinase CheA